MPTKVILENYIDDILGESGTSVPDSTIISGMEDVVRKLEMTDISLLQDMENITVIETSPVSVHYLQPTLDVYCNKERVIKRDNEQHISNKYSLLNDYGQTTYYYVVGNKLFIYPFVDTNTYTYRGIAYSVSGGRLTWCDRFNYPLALYCAILILFTRFSKEIEALILASSGLLVSPAGLPGMDETTLNSLYNRVIDRLNRHDTELSAAELELIKTQISAYSAQLGKDNVLSYKLQSRVQGAQQMLSRVATIRQLYTEYFQALKQEPQQ